MMIPEWVRPIRCYVSPSGRNKITDWYNDLSPTEQAAADEFLKDIRKLKKWERPNYRTLKNCNGLGELRWFAEKKQQRLIGFFLGVTWYAVIGCTHKQRIYSPSECLDTAKTRKKQIERGEVWTDQYDL